MLDPDHRVVRSSEPILAEFDDGFVMLSIEASKYFSLNATAEAIWRRMERPISLRALTASLAEEFDVAPAEAAGAVRTLVSRLVEEEIASVQGCAGAERIGAADGD
ncbi:MAG TPA: PqqD family protein [Caulobacteraceae bacterium]